MRKVLLIMTVLFVAGVSQTFAQKLGHVDTQKLMLALPERADAEKALQKFADEKMREINEMDSILQARYEKYMAERETMSQNMRAITEQELTEFQQRMELFRNDAQDKVVKKEQLLMEPMVKKVQDAIDDVAKEKGFDYVFDVNTLLFAGGTDITPMVKTKLGITE